MGRHAVAFRIVCFLAVAVALLLCLAPAQAQTTTNNTTNNTNNNNVAGVAGIEVDAQGVLQKKMFLDPGGQVSRQRAAAARATLSRDVIPPSKLRKISLTRLEKAIQANNGVLSEEMKYLAGLERVRFVFFYPETKDIVLAGPAEGFAPDASGRVVGMTTRRPTLQLQDLVVALRAFAPGKSGTSMIGCSIDPTPEGLANLQQFLRTAGSTLAPGQENALMAGLRASLGMQNVTINGVSSKTHFAQVLVEADYRMKLIGIGLEQPPVRMATFIEKATPVSRNSLFRWYFLPDYNCVRVSEDGLGMELVGDGVKLVSEDEMVTSGGERRDAINRKNAASVTFVTSFTQKYPQLAERSPVYAELRNLIDLSVTAAYLQKQDYYKKAGWKMPVFASEEALPVETYNAPKQVEPVVTGVRKGARLMTPIAGGVHINALMAIKPENLLSDEQGAVSKLHETIKPQLAPGQWWWD